MNNTNKIFSYIGFAVKSGQVVWGLDGLKKTSDRAALIVIDEALSEGSKKEAVFVSEQKKIPMIRLPQGELSAALRRNNVKVLSITDAGLAGAIIDSYH